MFSAFFDYLADRGYESDVIFSEFMSLCAEFDVLVIDAVLEGTAFDESGVWDE